VGRGKGSHVEGVEIQICWGGKRRGGPSIQQRGGVFRLDETGNVLGNKKKESIIKKGKKDRVSGGEGVI